MAWKDDLSTRMKTYYEYIPRTKLMRRTPVCIRLDGKAFHTFTRGFDEPFDDLLIESMQLTAKYLCENIQGCVIGYTQSDEITLILVDYKRLNSSAWFDYEVQKMCSISASMATMEFNRVFSSLYSKKYMALTSAEEKEALYQKYGRKSDSAMFDSRCFNIPKEEVANLLYWRQNDASKNSIQMVGQSYFSHKQLDKKNTSMIQDMLMEQYGVNWNNYPTYQKRGTCIVKNTICWVENKTEISEDNLRDPSKNPSEWIIDKEIPIFKGDGREYIEKLINF